MFVVATPGDMEVLLEVFSDVNDTWGTMLMMVILYSRLMEGGRFVLVRGEGYVMTK